MVIGDFLQKDFFKHKEKLFFEHFDKELFYEVNKERLAWPYASLVMQLLDHFEYKLRFFRRWKLNLVTSLDFRKTIYLDFKNPEWYEKTVSGIL